MGESIELEGRGPLSRPQIRLKGGGLPTKFTTDKVKSILNIDDGTTEAMTAVLQDIAGDGSMGDFIRSVGGARPEASDIRSTAEEAASEVINNGAERLRNLLNR